MRLPHLGVLVCEPGHGCLECGRTFEPDALDTLLHDLRCWGWRTALYNLRLRLSPPPWFPRSRSEL